MLFEECERFLTNYMLKFITMTWLEECRLWLRGKYPMNDGELENLMEALGVPQTELWKSTGQSMIIDKSKAHQRIRETLDSRCGSKVSILGALVSVLGAIATWIGVFSY